MSSLPLLVAELWRYPVKSMGGERQDALELTATGVLRDRRYAVVSTGAPRGKPMLSGAERAATLRFRAATGATGEITVTAPDGTACSLGDERLLPLMQQSLPGGHTLSLVASDRPLTDVRPVAILGRETVEALSREFGSAVHAQRFRANLLLSGGGAFLEDSLAGRHLRIGSAVLYVTERIPRCRIVTLDPVTGEASPALMKHLDRRHDGCLGVYATVVQPGIVCLGDAAGCAPLAATDLHRGFSHR